MKALYICPICGRAFIGKEDLSVTCSKECHQKYFRLGKHEREGLIAEAKEKRRPARTDCREYDPKIHDCDALNALWCTVEDCKFYKSKGDKS